MSLKADLIEMTDERDEWKARCEFSFKQRDKLTAERDAYAKCSDDMAAAHKVERDEYIRCYNVLTRNAEKHLKELQIRQDCTSFFTARARSLANESLALQAERDALKEAARLALDALIFYTEAEADDYQYKPAQDAIAALKAVLE